MSSPFQIIQHRYFVQSMKTPEGEWRKANDLQWAMTGHEWSIYQSNLKNEDAPASRLQAIPLSSKQIKVAILDG